MSSLSADQVRRIQSLYETMPSAPMPFKEDGRYMWGDVEGNDHWLFCERIVRLMDEAAGRAVNMLASSHNLV